MVKFTQAYMLWALTKPGSPFAYRKHFLACPNLSWGLLDWEADLAVFTKAGSLWEIEIKVSAADWRQDAAKTKWAAMAKQNNNLKPRRFYYAAPIELAKRYAEMGIPDWAGVVGVDPKPGGARITIIKPCVEQKVRGATDVEMLKAARLASMRFWRENHKRVQMERKL